MDFAYSEKVEALRTQVRDFMDAHIVPHASGSIARKWRAGFSPSRSWTT